jgi:hypothetical protein
MSTAATCTDCTSIMNFPKIGFGSDFEKLHEYVENIVREFKKAKTLGRQDDALQTLDEIFVECSQDGWDGYDAVPITEEAYLEGKRFLLSLPVTSFIPMPEVIPQPNGEIAFEWAKGNRQIFIASVSGQHEITFAGLFGVNRIHGTEYFADSLPQVILENLRRLYLLG